MSARKPIRKPQQENQERQTYALGKPAQRAVLALARERDGLAQQIQEVNQALLELARTYGRTFRDDADACTWYFSGDEGQVVLVCVEGEKPTAEQPDTEEPAG